MRSCRSAARCTVSSTQPASTTMLKLAGSAARTRSMRSRLTTSSSPAAEGVAPPTSPVLPPCGTTATPWSRLRAMTAATEPVSAGRTTASGRPVRSPDQSRQ